MPSNDYQRARGEMLRATLLNALSSAKQKTAAELAKEVGRSHNAVRVQLAKMAERKLVLPCQREGTRRPYKLGAKGRKALEARAQQ